MKRIGLLGGSFNPVHIGHTMLASYMAQYTWLDEVWLVLSPLNPLKLNPKELASDAQRLEMLSIALKGAERISVCDIELSMPKPSYSIDTLKALSERHPEAKFEWILGSDNWLIIDRWKDADTIINNYGVIVYPRPGYPIDSSALPHGVASIDAPTINLSSSFIRQGLQKGLDMNFFLPPGVYNYISIHKLYQTTH